ncbi:unnamed protein product [Effrenium voratum]|uniref:Fe2OG dioxygenase domain-containing protein n=1 Tax=Effrenium voratum TaxID=2562239 RepID=A0AA36MYU2_9DINO|nr:unnamed protein product [Effrenium voratum]CAJ1438337.1 unnamed protein product [Effrenium voratum]
MASNVDPPYLLRGHGKLGNLGLRPRIALVSTLRDVQDQFLLWCEWFRIIGFAHLFLYFDDEECDQASIEAACSTYSADFLSIALNTPQLREEWASLRTWKQFSVFTEDRMCRQLLNIAHALKRAARGEGPEAVDWMFHLDHDELFLPPEGLQAHFQHLEDGGCRLCLYQNFEAAPQAHTLTPFLDVSLFKVPSGRVAKTPLGAAGMNFWAQRTKAGTHFLYYDNGKSAVRVRRNVEIAPTSVHLLYPPEDLEELITKRQAWTNFPKHELADMELDWMISCHDEVVAGAKVLHYPATHYDRLFRKYLHLGNFPAVRFGGELVIPASFHLEARDEFLKYDDQESRKAKLKELLEKAAFLQTEAEVQTQLETGSVVVIDTVRETLRAGRWVPPRQLRPSAASWALRRPSVQGMERLQRMRRQAAEVLFQGGGMLRDLDAALDTIAQRLQTHGWVACELGAHRKLMERAVQEAQGLKSRMSRGSTVIENHILDPGMSNDRGDQVLFMEEQGLTGPEAAKGPAPTLALLNSALADVGFQLDQRLQKTMALRLTERCDGMLSCYGPENGGYSAHVDNADGDGQVAGRVLTAILYLNAGWDRQDAGELAIFHPEKGDIGDADVQGRWHMVHPEANTLVLLRADQTLHEVRSSRAERFAISVWFCGQHAEYGGS